MVPDPAPDANGARTIDEQNDLVGSKQVFAKNAVQNDKASSEKAWRNPGDGGETSDLTIDKLVGYDKNRKDLLVRWFGNTEKVDTWQDAKDLP